jgi:modulator of FtsH protease HflC
MTVNIPMYRDKPMRFSLKTPVIAVSIAALLAAANASMFRVPQNEVGFVTRFGKVQNLEGGPLQPGLHFKMPFIDDSDMLSVSTDTVKMAPMKAFTRDTQEVNLQVSLTYNVPPAAAYHLLYEVGRSGNVDIANNLDAVSNDRVRSIVSRRDVTDIAGEGREKIIEEIKTTIASELKRLFQINVQDVQIPMLDFSAQYKEAVNRSTLARAQRLQAEQDRERARVEAETVIVRAKGDAESQYAKAEGAARAQLTQAKAEAEGTKLRGDAEASAIHAKIEAAGGVEGYARQIQAQAALNWRGEVPQISSGGAGTSQMPIVLPLQLTPPANIEKK